jgi:hypothetical protein
MTSGDAELWAARGLPLDSNTHGDPDWTSLPVFGGSEPDETTGIWSWDETHLIVGSSADDLEIVERP